MPNHCENDLWIDGQPEERDALLALLGVNDSPPRFDFNVVIPYPQRWAEMDEARPGYGLPADERSAAMAAYKAKYGTEADGFNSGGYEWCRDNWGTKWNAYDVARRDYGGVCITFQTAWSPPLPVIKALAERFPKLSITLEFFERGMEYSGGVRYQPTDEVDEGEDRCTEWESKDYRGTRGG